MQHYTLAELAEFLGAELHGDPKIIITGLNTLNNAQNGELTFLDNPKYRKYLPHTKASAVILTPEDAKECPTNALITAKPYIAYAKITHKFIPTLHTTNGIHPTATIEQNCQIHPSASIGPHCVIGLNAIIAENVVLGAGCVIGEGVQIGAQTRFYPNVTIYYGVRIGERVIIHSGAVVGSDGFGFANENGNWLKIPQLGGVIIGNDVEIGANTTIDRGALADTIIENDVKLDNQIQVAHNVKIGAHTAIAACTGIAGSTTIGKYCLIGGGVGIAGHIDITDKVVITAMSGVSKSITEPGIYSSGFPVEKGRDWWKNMARFRQLDEMARKLEKLIEERE